jgi:hypothetical protein
MMLQVKVDVFTENDYSLAEQKFQNLEVKTTGATCSDGMPERHLSILGPVIYYYFGVEAPSVSNIPSFFHNGICYQRRKNLFYFPSATAAPVRKQLGRWDLLLRFQSRNGEKKKKQIRADAGPK